MFLYLIKILMENIQLKVLNNNLEQLPNINGDP